jgi:site-specific recombinase XerD
VEGEVQQLLDVIEASTHTGLRDRALLGVLAYTFARIGAVVNLKVQDYYPSGKRFFLRFKEKGGKEKELPVHHKLEELLDEYLKATGLGNEPGSLLFPAALGKTGKLSRRQLMRTDAADMLKRRLKQAGLPAPLFAALIPGDRHHEFSGEDSIWRRDKTPRGTPSVVRETFLPRHLLAAMKLLMPLS